MLYPKQQVPSNFGSRPLFDCGTVGKALYLRSTYCEYGARSYLAAMANAIATGRVQMSQTENAYMPEVEFCAMYGISPRTAHRWRKEGLGPAFTPLGKRIFYRKSAVSEWATERERKIATPESRAR